MARRCQNQPIALPLTPEELWAVYDDQTGEIMGSKKDVCGSIPIFASHENATRFADQCRKSGNRNVIIRLIGVSPRWQFEAERAAEALTLSHDSLQLAESNRDKLSDRFRKLNKQLISPKEMTNGDCDHDDDDSDQEEQARSQDDRDSRRPAAQRVHHAR